MSRYQMASSYLFNPLFIQTKNLNSGFILMSDKKSTPLFYSSEMPIRLVSSIYTAKSNTNQSSESNTTSHAKRPSYPYQPCPPLHQLTSTSSLIPPQPRNRLSSSQTLRSTSPLLLSRRALISLLIQITRSLPLPSRVRVR